MLVCWQTFEWLLFIGPVILVSIGMYGVLYFQFSLMFVFVVIHCLNIAVRHASTPVSDYKLFYTKELSLDELKPQLMLFGGIYLTPVAAQRDVYRTIALTGINRDLIKKMQLFTD